MRQFYQYTAKFFAIIFLILIFSNTSNSQWAQRWVSTFTQAGTTDEYPLDMKIDDDDNIYIAGYAYNGFDDDILLIKYDFSGNLLWEKIFNTLNSANDYATSIDIDNDGNIYVCGLSKGTPSKFIIIKYNNEGEELWVREVIEGGADFGVGNSFYNFEIKVGPDGKIYACGQLKNPNSDYDVTLVKLNSSGEIEWEDTYDAANLSDYCPHIEFDKLGNILMGFSSEEVDVWIDFALISYDTSGMKNWISRFSSGTNTPEYVQEMAISSEDEIYLIGSTFAVSLLTVKFNTNGEILWHDIISHQMYPNDVAIDGNDNLIIGGRKYNFAYSNDYFAVKYDKTGDTLWYRLYNSIGNHQDVGNAVTVDYRNNVYLTGGVGDVGLWDQDYGTLLYDINGNNILIERYDTPGSGFDMGHEIAFNSNDELVVTGHSHNELEGYNIVTLKYSDVVGIENLSTEVPDKFLLSQNYPNPFNPATSIKFALPKSGFVTLKVYDIVGKEVATLVNEQLTAGTYEHNFNASALSSGVYFYRIDADNFTEIKKMMLVK